ncbi:galectin-related protein A-like isoform X2 [Hoplias malabaricus]|uniref:galectin-related protein A-like isoform X2 n=1 Tax=Hoplias malabaricus TaxID=27720 RepID=UPI0034624B97
MTEADKTRQEEDYIGEIKGGLRPSMRLVVMGIVHKQPKSMVVTLSCPSQGEGDEKEEGDVGMQMTISFTEKAIRRNFRKDGKWGTSENTLSFFPFAAGEAFKGAGVIGSNPNIVGSLSVRSLVSSPCVREGVQVSHIVLSQA